MNKEYVLHLITGKEYYSIDDLRYNQKLGFLFSKEKFSEFLSIKEQLVDEKDPHIKEIPLKAFNSKYCFFVKGEYLNSLKSEYERLLFTDYEMNKSFLFDRNIEDILKSRLFSEIEGTLTIENVPTTHKRIIELHKNAEPKDQNDIIVKNMIRAVQYIVEEAPAFNKENLRKLYHMLSNGCLADEIKLKEGAYYRDDNVYIGEYEGASYQEIDTYMDSLFVFANDEAMIKEYGDFLPHICHYYILYVHPYFDYNGRTARMVSFWLNYVHRIVTAPYFMSEAINENKGNYYRALMNTRSTGNDLTYFLGYILDTAIQYSFVYKNLEEMRKELAKTGDTLTSGEWVYVKKILVHNAENYFNPKMFLDYIHTNMTRQGAIKILDHLTGYGILEKSKNKKGDNIYKLRQEWITYRYVT